MSFMDIDKLIIQVAKTYKADNNLATDEEAVAQIKEKLAAAKPIAHNTTVRLLHPSRFGPIGVRHCPYMVSGCQGDPPSWLYTTECFALPLCTKWCSGTLMDNANHKACLIITYVFMWPAKVLQLKIYRTISLMLLMLRECFQKPRSDEYSI